jgi:hypothetical protein
MQAPLYDREAKVEEPQYQSSHSIQPVGRLQEAVPLPTEVLAKGLLTITRLQSAQVDAPAPTVMAPLLVLIWPLITQLALTVMAPLDFIWPLTILFAPTKMKPIPGPCKRLSVWASAPTDMEPLACMVTRPSISWPDARRVEFADDRRAAPPIVMALMDLISTGPLVPAPVPMNSILAPAPTVKAPWTRKVHSGSVTPLASSVRTPLKYVAVANV